MKTALAPILILMLMLSACASLETNAYKVIATTAVTVDGARKGWNDYAMQGHATRKEVEIVADYYADYQRAMATAQKAVEGYKVSKNDAELQKALDGVSKAAKELVGEINYYMGGLNK